ncbi:unnamed protein product [Ostreobium quekettii]|uniref:Leucine-binding protein domain-containing protein n=1 Tax=Ostreobium quekettii TaxID=121088 RepID=A0A8S1JC20_9CHLO|nr:unnamed protein product [Ostreobium quekettii]
MMARPRVRLPGMAIALLGALLLAGSPRAGAQDGAGGAAFRVGAVLSSVNETRTMQDARRGYQLALDMVNALEDGRGLKVEGRDGAVHFRFEFTALDDLNDKENHTALVQTLLQGEAVHFMFGSHPKFAISESNISDAAGRILYHCCVGPDEVYQEGYRNVFGVTVTNRRYTELAISSMNLKQISRVAIVRQSDNIFTNTTCDEAVEYLSRFRRTVNVLTPNLLSPVINYTKAEVDGDPDWFRAYVRSLRDNQAEALIACALLPEGRRLFEALHEARYPLRTFFLTSGPTREDFVADLDPITANSILSAAQWSTDVQYKDSFFGSTQDYRDRYKDIFEITPSALAAGASAVAYTLTEAIKSAFKNCDVLAFKGNPDGLLFSPNLICDDQVNSNTGYERVRLALKGLNMDTFFGKVRFDEFQRNIGMDPVTTQIQVKQGKQGEQAHKNIVAVLPVEAASASLKMPADNAYRNTCISGQFLSTLAEHFFEPCQTCPEGEVTYQEDELSCRSCPPGHYWESATSCQVCPPTTQLSGNSTRGIGIESCVCQESYYHPDGDNRGKKCYECPTGAKCAGGVNVTLSSDSGICPEAGFWIEAETKEVYECEPRSLCLGGCDLTMQCKAGHTGRLCSFCQDEYYNFLGNCHECLPAFVFGFMVVALLIAWYILNVVVSNNVASLDMLLSWAQLANIIGEVDLNWPVKLSFMFNIANILDFDVDILSPSCLLPWSYKQNFIVQLLLPLIMTMLAIVGFLLSWMMYSFYRRCSEERRKMIHSSHWLHWLVNVPENRDQLLAKLDFTIAAFFSSLEVTYVTISKYCFDAFKCEDIGKQSVLRTSPDIECGSSEHRDIVKLGVVGSVVYTGGYLCFVSWKLWVLNREQSFPDPVNLRRYGWLYRRFELDYFWTSLIVVARKLLFVVVLVFVNNPAFQAGALAIIINASLMLHVYTAPYVDSFLDILFSFLLIALMFEAFGGVMFFSDNLLEENRQILEGIVLGSLFLLFAVFIVMFLWETRRLYHLQKVRHLHERVILDKEKWKLIDSKKQQRSEVSHELLGTFDPSFLYRALVTTPKNIEDWDKLTDMLKAFMSDQSETSYLSMGNKAKFWRNLVERFPELVDFLAVTDAETRAHFREFATALYNDFYLKKKVEDLPLYDVLNWRDRAALAQWLAMAKDEERTFFTSVMEKLFRTARGDEVAKLFETKVKSMGRSLSRPAASVQPPSFKWDLKRRRSKVHDDIIREINAGQGPLAHKASKKFRCAATRCDNVVCAAECAQNASLVSLKPYATVDMGMIVEEDIQTLEPCLQGGTSVCSPLRTGSETMACSSTHSSVLDNRCEEIDSSYELSRPSPLSPGWSTCYSTHEEGPGHNPGPSRGLESFEVFDSAKDRPGYGASVGLVTLLIYMFRRRLDWSDKDKRGVEASTPRECDAEDSSDFSKVELGAEQGESRDQSDKLSG